MNDANSSDGIKRVFGMVLIVAGILWLVTAGLCTIIFAPFVFSGPGVGSDDFVTMIVIVVPSFLFGAGLIAGGRYLRR
jgi:hypothetical protein